MRTLRKRMLACRAAHSGTGQERTPSAGVAGAGACASGSGPVAAESVPAGSALWPAAMARSAATSPTTKANGLCCPCTHGQGHQ